MTAIDPPRRRSFVPAVLRLKPLARREATWGYILIAPWVIGFLAFTFLPMVASFIFTFTNINLAQEKPLAFIGLTNWLRLFNDQTTWDALGVTFRFAALNLPIALIIPFVIALALNSTYLRWPSLFRTLFFLPYVIPFVAGILIWQSMLNLETGWVNAFLEFIGIKNPPNWLQDPRFVYPSLVFLGLWGIGAGIIVNLASWGSSIGAYDAAWIDGAPLGAQPRNVTLPMMLAVIFYALILGPRRRPPALPRPAGPLQRHRRAAGHDAVLQPVPLQTVLHVPEHVVRLDAGVVAVPHHAWDHARPLPDVAALGLLRG
jgi:multiple sugar transport system permease protein